jgi:hypothetical protein
MATSALAPSKNRLELTPLCGEIGVQTILLQQILAILRGKPRVAWSIVQCRKTYLTDWLANGQVQLSFRHKILRNIQLFHAPGKLLDSCFGQHFTTIWRDGSYIIYYSRTLILATQT